MLRPELENWVKDVAVHINTIYYLNMESIRLLLLLLLLFTTIFLLLIISGAKI